MAILTGIAVNPAHAMACSGEQLQSRATKAEAEDGRQRFRFMRPREGMARESSKSAHASTPSAKFIQKGGKNLRKINGIGKFENVLTMPPETAKVKKASTTSRQISKISAFCA
jgi:hypothetical protein